MMLLVLLALAVLSSLAVAADDRGAPYPRIANCYAVGLSPQNTPQDLEEIGRFDLLIGGLWCNWADADQRKALADNIATIRKANPHIIILDFSSSAPYADPKDTSFPADGWLLQPDGKRIAGWPGTDMINLLKPRVLQWLAARSVRSVREWGFDGTFIDCMGSGFDWWACNIESGEAYQVDADGDGKADDRAWLDQQWIAAKTDLARLVRDALPDTPFMTNQAGDWGLPTMNGILLEDYLDYVLDGNWTWDRVMADYLKWNRVTHRPCLTTIVSSSAVQPPFDPWRTLNEAGRTALLEQGRGLKQRMRFGLATTLMGDGYFAYDLHTRWRGQRWWYPEYDAPLGYPKGPGKAQPDGSWRREFDGGTAVVNPTPFDARVALSRRHRDVSSGKVDREFIIPPNDGRILLPTDAPAAAGDMPDPAPAMTFRGPERVVTRADRVLVRLDGLVALFDPQGRLLKLTDGTRTLAEGLRPFVVSNDRWQDFAYTDLAHRVQSDGDLEFTGRRTEGTSALAFRQVVRARGRSLTVSYQWRAVTDLHVHMWRQQVDFPVNVYGGATVDSGGEELALPISRAPEPNLLRDATTLVFAPRRGPRLTVETPDKASLVDERHYGVEAYRLGSYPAAGDLKAGSRWSWQITLTVK